MRLGIMDTTSLFSDIEVKDLFGDFGYKDRADGRISVDRKWIRENIVTFNGFLLSGISCHRLVEDKLAKILKGIQRSGLSRFIDVNDTVRRGGCFFPRHINWDINMPLSRHSWGIAIDINPSANQTGTSGNVNPAIVEIFEKNGFAWGGRWLVPDPMHFEIARFCRVQAFTGTSLAGAAP